jgi:TM2 domain-containing membrane protein YozV
VNIPTKAACLSAFVFPGSGHFFLKCHLRGILFATIAAIGLFLIMQSAFAIAWDIAQDIEHGKIPFNISSIRSVVQKAMTIYNEPSLMMAKSAIIASWSVSTIDAYRVGKKRERMNDS